jgi:hypothetical protein
MNGDIGYHIGAALAAEHKLLGRQGISALPPEHKPLLDDLQAALWGDLMRPGSLWSNIRLVHDGRDLHPSRFMAGRIGDGLIVHSYLDFSKVTDYLIDGGTLIYNHLHESSRVVQRIQETLEYLLNARVWIQAYLTRTSESAFGAHVDDHNIIVLQVFGYKCWEIAFKKGGAVSPTTTKRLAPGDLIAVPANIPHEVNGCGTLSLHLTIAFDWLDSSTPGSVIPDSERAHYWASSRIGSAIPLILCDDISALRLSFKFRDRVRPAVSVGDTAVIVKCVSGKYLIDLRFGDLADELAKGREFTKSEIMENVGSSLTDGDIDKFLKFGIENGMLHCSG